MRKLFLILITVVSMRYITGEKMFTFNHDTGVMKHYSRSGELINCWIEDGYHKIKQIKCKEN